MNNLVREVDPSFLRNQLHQFLLDFLRRVPLGEIQAMRDAEYMRIHDHALRLAEADSQHHIRRLARRPGTVMSSASVSGTLPPKSSLILRPAP